MDGEPQDIDFGAPMMPDLGGMAKMMRMMALLPAMISAVSFFVIIFLGLVVYNGLVQGDYNMTFGAFMNMVLLSMGVGTFIGIIVMYNAQKNMKKQMLF